CILAALPPQTTLFPYTTLFRSSENAREYHGKRRPAALHRVSVPRFIGGILAKPADWEIAALSRCPKESAIAAAAMATQSLFANGDRKSTRLNSSDLGISYAVFC